MTLPQRNVNHHPRTELVQVEFHGQAIEAIERDGQVWLALNSICDNLGINARSQRKKIKENPSFAQGWGDITLPSRGGTQEAFCISLDILTLWLGSISAARVKSEIKDTLIKYQRECMSVLSAHFFGDLAPSNPAPAIPASLAQQALAQAQALVAIEQQQQALAQAQQVHDSRISTVERRLDDQQQRQKQAAREILALPEPKDLPQPRSLRSILVERMRQVAEMNNYQHRDCWNKLYREYYHRAGIDLKARAKNRGYKPLDMAVSLGVVGKLYDLCCHLWPTDLGDMLSDTSNTLNY